MSYIEVEFAARLGSLVDGRAYPVALPQDAEYPAITYHRLNTQNQKEEFGLGDVKAVEASAEKAMFQVVIWGESYKPLALLLRSVRAELSAIPDLQFEDAQDGLDTEKKLYSIIIDCAVWGDLDAVRGAIAAPASHPVADYENAIVSTLAAGLSGVNVALFNPKERVFSALPAVRVRVGNGDDLQVLGDEQIRLAFDVSIHCFHAANQPWARELAANVAAIVGVDQQWSMPQNVSFPENQKMIEGARNPGVNGFSQWLVNFVQRVTISRPPVDDTEVPTDVRLSMSPEIGIPHEPDYETVYEQ